MAIGGSPENIRQEARRLRRQADDVESTAARVRSGSGVEWVGTASERYRERLRGHAREIEETRQRIVATADRLDELADTLEERQRAIARATELVEDAIGSARRTLGHLAGAVWDELTGAEKEAERAARGLLDTVRDLPAPGHPDWLELAERVRR